MARNNHPTSSDFLAKVSLDSRGSGRGYTYLVGGYFLKEKLGEGGQAKVFKALNGKEGFKAYAVKQFELNKNKGPQAVPDGLSRTLKEADMMRSLHADPERPNLHILRVFESLVTSRHLYIVLEYCAKGSLDKEIRRSADQAAHTDPDRGAGLSEQRAVFYLTQLVAGMVEVWDKRIIHRDIKLENMMLTDDNIVKIADFGFAIFDHEDKTWAGTITHMAPEILEISTKGRKGDYDFRVDLWSIGVTFYQLLHGRVPFLALTAPGIYDEILKGLSKGLAFGDHVGPEARDLVLGLLVLDPLKRLVGDRLTGHPLFQKYKKARQGSVVERNVIDRYKLAMGPMGPGSRGLPNTEQLRRGLGALDDPEKSVVPDAMDVIEAQMSTQADATSLILYGVQEVSHVYLHELNKLNFLAFVVQRLFLFLDSFNFRLADFGLANAGSLVLRLAAMDTGLLLQGLDKRANEFGLDAEFFRFIMEQESGLQGEIITPRLARIRTRVVSLESLIANYQLVLGLFASQKRVALVHATTRAGAGLNRTQLFGGLGVHLAELQHFLSKDELRKNPRALADFQRLLSLLEYVANYDGLFPYYDRPHAWGKFDWKAFRSAVETVRPKEIDQMLRGSLESGSRSSRSSWSHRSSLPHLPKYG